MSATPARIPQPLPRSIPVPSGDTGGGAAGVAGSGSGGGTGGSEPRGLGPEGMALISFFVASTPLFKRSSSVV